MYPLKVKIIGVPGWVSGLSVPTLDLGSAHGLRLVKSSPSRSRSGAMARNAQYEFSEVLKVNVQLS